MELCLPQRLLQWSLSINTEALEALVVGILRIKQSIEIAFDKAEVEMSSESIGEQDMTRSLTTFLGGKARRPRRERHVLITGLQIPPFPTTSNAKTSRQPEITVYSVALGLYNNPMTIGG